MDSFDDLVIGTGQAGKPLASALAAARARVGGACILTACTPTKTMIASAAVAHTVRTAASHGVHTGPVVIDLERIRARKRAVVESFSDARRDALAEHDTLEIVHGTARLVGGRQVEVELREGGSRTIEAERVFINTGTRPSRPPIDGLDSVRALDGAALMELPEVPDHLVVLGGGFVGLEFAQLYRRLGARVTIVESGPQLLAREDPEVAAAVRDLLEDEGVAVRTGAQARQVAPDEGGIRLALEGGDAPAVRASHLLIAVGREPATEALEPQAWGIDTDDDGYIRVNGRLETSAARVWALGDVNGGPPFTHIAYDDFRVVRRNLIDEGHDFGAGPATRDDRLVPYTLYTDPQLGRVGLTESQAREAGREVRVARIPLERVARAAETDRRRGFLKAVVDVPTDRILGAAVLAPEGGELATMLQIAMMGDLPTARLRDAVVSHPTWGEALNTLFSAG